MAWKRTKGTQLSHSGTEHEKMPIPGAGLRNESLGPRPAPTAYQVMDEEGTKKPVGGKALKLHVAVKAVKGRGLP